MYKKYVIDKNYENIYYYLKEQGFSENFISNLRKKKGNIKVNNEITNIKHKLLPNDVLEIEASPNSKTTIMQCIIPLNIVYEDEYYLLINKPSGLSCMPNKSHYSSNLAGAICYYFKEENNFVLRIINRLDKDTSGLLLVAKDSISQKDIKDIKKEYHAITEGKIDKNMVVNKKIETLSINGINSQKRIVSENGKEATTYISPLKYNESYSLVSLTLEHGRTHQIRLHLSSINHPLVGDELYGKINSQLNHTALICKRFSFYHPYLNKNLLFEVDYPEDIKKFLKDNLLN